MSNNPNSNLQDTNNNVIETSTNRTTGDSTNTTEENPTSTLGNINTSTLELSDITIHACSNCGEPAQYLCIACGQSGPRYCSSKCQSEDWTRRHSTVCSKVTLAGQINEEGGDEEIATVRKPNSKVHGRGNIAQIINKRKTNIQRGNPISPSSTTDPSFTGQEPLSTSQFDEDQVDEFKFYMQQIYKIIKPVVLCILLSVLWVKISILAPNFRPQRPTQQFIDTSDDTSESAQIFNSFLAAAVIIGNIIIVTIIIVCLFKYGFIKILIGFFMVVVLLLLGFMGYLLILTILQVLQIPMDYITLSFALWNFAAVGLISVFWKGPLLLQQTYLTIMSSLMAFSLTNLSSWTTWILLALLVIWDLVAVLCPFGPLRILVESSRNDKREIPALLYSVNAVWFMASPSLSNQFTSSSLNSVRQSLSSASSFQVTVGEEIPLSENIRYNHGEGGVSGESNENLSQIPRRQSSSLQPRSQPPNNDSFEEEEEEDERSGLKLGLGDFVFYSVLVAQAALFDWITTVACIVAVLTGLNTTIFLLAIYKKALPALPISIAFGMLFYFVARNTLVPYAQSLGLSLIAV
ncbi:hypothetical protein RclHR1_09770006 [Rhizophagus clarus]|uniref:Presenilin n=1 Tax=Rhizophagus clarus TaxID=94130 RepID=A0A2Z6SBB7_9GLOM|nr:hypothetical protein RclHR1_09770006 [Rhizophagus clarus]GES90567.1 presenilin-1-like isoform X1 [Rhizophagus clarus]